MPSSSKKARNNNHPDKVDYVVEPFKEVQPLTEVQQEYLDNIRNKSIIFGLGSAGTGKTYVSAAYAASQLYHKKINEIVITRPNIEVGASLGFLPGSLNEKYYPYLEPFENVFIKFLGKGMYDYCLKNGNIIPKPIGYMRGLSFENCIVLIDECQNMTKTQFLMLLSRIGRNCKMILSGDPKQIDIRNSGLNDCISRLKNVEGISISYFTKEDIVRSKLCKQIILAYNS